MEWIINQYSMPTYNIYVYEYNNAYCMSMVHKYTCKKKLKSVLENQQNTFTFENSQQN